MIAADSSAWIEYLRDTGHPVGETLSNLVGTDELAVTEHVVMEVLAGARSARNLRELRSLLLNHRVLFLEGLADYEEAAALYRICRRGGETIRKLGDCLVAVPVIREGAELLHNDSDFDAIARHSALRVYSVG